MSTINPYHYRYLSSKLGPLRGMELQDSLFTNDPDYRNRLDGVLDRLGSEALNRLLSILSLKVGASTVNSVEQLAKVRDENIAQNKKDFEDYGSYELPEEITMILMVAAESKPGRFDWGTLQDVYGELPEGQQQAFSDLFKDLFSVEVPAIFEEKPKLWAIPEKIQDLPPSHMICGRPFYEYEPTKWRRLDLALQDYSVKIVHRYKEHDDEDGSYEYYTRHILCGCAASLEGAIEVATKISKDLTAKFRNIGKNLYELWSSEYLAVEIYRGRDRLLRADLDAYPDANVESATGQEMVDVPYQVTWRHPLEKGQVEVAKKKIQDLRSEAAFESGWDNYSTAQRLRAEADRLSEDLPSKTHDAYEIQDILRQTLYRLRDDKQMSAIFSRDLGL